MQCVSPAVQDLDEHEDWFCPLCTAMASLIADVQSAYTGDEWGGDEEDTVHSWENVGDVFPEAPREMEMALRWKEGKHDDELVQFLSELLGMPVAEDKSNNNDDDDDSEEDSEDDNFDDQDESSRTSSQDSLQDLLSIEINIDRKELDALSLESKEENAGRRTCRSSRATSAESCSMDDSDRQNVGALDESNIVEGKRRRKQVDYRK
jgi:hypothetical protein